MDNSIRRFRNFWSYQKIFFNKKVRLEKLKFQKYLQISTNIYKYIQNISFSNLTFWLCNHVESPLHMSAKVLPMQLKEKIYNDIDNYVFNELCQERIKFYVDHMMEEDLWPTEGKVFMNYLQNVYTILVYMNI